ncbi:MAG: hypothetical protein ACK559_32365, partial [bacterium]
GGGGEPEHGLVRHGAAGARGLGDQPVVHLLEAPERLAEQLPAALGAALALGGAQALLGGGVAGPGRGAGPPIGAGAGAGALGGAGGLGFARAGALHAGGPSGADPDPRGPPRPAGSAPRLPGLQRPAPLHHRVPGQVGLEDSVGRHQPEPAALLERDRAQRGPGQRERRGAVEDQRVVAQD